MNGKSLIELKRHITYLHVFDPVSDSQRFSFEVGQFVMLGAFLKDPQPEILKSFVERLFHFFISFATSFRAYYKR
jgi:hypothetical protein